MTTTGLRVQTSPLFSCKTCFLHGNRDKVKSFSSFRDRRFDNFYGGSLEMRRIRSFAQRDGDDVVKTRMKNKEDRTRALKDFRIVASLVSALFAGFAVYLNNADSEISIDLNIDAVPAIAGVLLAISFQYASPLQLLLVFIGKFETERPVDWVASQFSSRPSEWMANKLDGGSENVAPSIVPLLASQTLIASSGILLSFLISRSIGDTWALSTAIGTSFLAFLYEIGRPKRLSVDEVQKREKAWEDFQVFADEGLVKAGSCHESEILEAFTKEYPGYKNDASGEEARKRLRKFIFQWNPVAERKPYGFFKNVALKSKFTKAASPVE